jgi:small subunit ribosomal protein S16
MVKLRLRRKGRTHHAVYDIVAIDSRKKRDGDFLERLGYYDPHTKPSTANINSDRAIYWLNVGAQPTDIVRDILSFEGVLLKRALQFKGKDAAEIETLMTEHKEKARANYFRKKELRKKRAEAKIQAEIKAKADAEAAEAAAAAAAANAEETPAE